MKRTASNRREGSRWLRAAAFAFVAATWGTSAYAVTAIGPGPTNASTLTGNSTFNTTAADTLVLDGALPGNTLTYNLLNNNTGFTDTIDADGNTSTISGAISGTGALTFTNSTGTGIIYLSNVNTYVGATTIDSSGDVRLSGGGSISSSSNIIDNGSFSISGITGSTASIVSLDGTGSVVLGSRTLNLTEAGGTFSGDIGSDAAGGGLKISDGTETLTGANAYTGLTTINGSATLALSSSGSIAASSGVKDFSVLDITGHTGNVSIATLSQNGTVTLGSNTLILTAAADTFSGAINGSGGLEINGGTETLSGANTYSGATTIDSGADLVIGANANSISSSSGVAITSGTLDVQTAGANIKSLSGSGSVLLDSQTLKLTAATGSFSGNISGSGGNLQIHSGTETLTGTNSYSGATIIDGSGKLDISGAGDIHLSSGVTNNGTFDISQATTAPTTVSIKDLSGASTSNVYLGQNTLILTSASGTYAGVIADAGGAIPADTGGGLHITSGSETLSGVNTYAGATIIDSGAYLHIGGTGSLADSTVAANGTFDIAVAGGASSIKSLSGTGNVTLGGNTLTLVNAADTFDGVISGASGSLALTTGTETLTGTNIYSGSTAINGGTLALKTGGSIEDSSTVTVAGSATFDISQTTSGASITTLAGLGHVDLGDQTLTLTNASTTFGGILEDSGITSGTTGKLTLDSNGGTETLSGANTYHGTTTVTLGTLKAGAADTFSKFSDVVMAADANAVLNLNNYDQEIKSLKGGTVSLSGDVQLGTKTLTIDNGSNGGTWDGTISGSGGIRSDDRRHIHGRWRKHLYGPDHHRQPHDAGADGLGQYRGQQPGPR